MAYRMVIVLVLAVALAGCASRKPASQPEASTAKAPAQAAPESAARSGTSYMTPGSSYSGPLPDMERGRQINEQDCTKDIDLKAGNLRCR